MKLNEDIISERNRIASSNQHFTFCFPLRHTPLLASDMVDHKNQLEKVYKYMLREACVIDDCCRRLEKIEGRWN